MNFLQLCQRLRQECSISGSGPTSVVGQSGEMQRLVDWTNQAWTEIQEFRPNWNWMVGAFSFQTVAGQYEYTPTEAGINTTFANWKLDSVRTFLTAQGVGSEQYCSFTPYDCFRDFYLFSTHTTSLSQPLEISVAPNKNLLLGYPPNAVYTCRGEYYKLPQVLAADVDTPDMPARFHMMIVYRAMMEYAAYTASPEVYQRAEQRYREMLHRLEQDQLPMPETGPCLA